MNKVKFKKFIFIFLFVFSFVILGKTSSSFYKTHNSNKILERKLYVFSIVDFIDFKFINVIPFIEPASIDSFSYLPKKFEIFNKAAFDLYGYDLLERYNHQSENCFDYFYRTSIINKCIVKNKWQNKTKKEWSFLSKKYNINYIFSGFPIPNLKLCKKYSLFDNKKKSITERIFYYKIEEKLNYPHSCEKLLIRNNSRFKVIANY